VSVGKNRLKPQTISKQPTINPKTFNIIYLIF
jgi:hypothetical protein